MKRILLIRHGKAARGEGLRDMDRPLTGRGKNQALEMASVIAERKDVPDLIISSPAKRALGTARVMADVWHVDETRILTEKLLYEGTPEGYAEVLETLPDGYRCVAVIAHNPTIGYLAELFSTGAIQVFSPCSVAAFRVETTEWAGWYPAVKQLLFLAVPSS